jgi:hypothetical protein
MPVMALPQKGAGWFGIKSTVKEAGQPSPDDLLGLAHDAVDQFLDCRDVVDQTDHQAAAPCAGIHLTVDHHLGVDACRQLKLMSFCL